MFQRIISWTIVLSIFISVVIFFVWMIISAPAWHSSAPLTDKPQTFSAYIVQLDSLKQPVDSGYTEVSIKGTELIAFTALDGHLYSQDDYYNKTHVYWVTDALDQGLKEVDLRNGQSYKIGLVTGQSLSNNRKVMDSIKNETEFYNNYTSDR